MYTLFHSLVTLLATATDSQLRRYIEFLKAENEILRARLPAEIHTRPAERARLLEFGLPLGKAIEELITIVAPSTFYRWRREASRGKPRRPRTQGKSQVLRELVIQVARSTGFGYTKILGELRRLGISRICRQTVRNILKEEGIEPSPRRSRGTWGKFLRAHAETLWACDFFTKRAITASGIVDLYMLVFMHLETREIICTKSTKNPNSQWVTEQAREFAEQTKTREHRPTHLVHDRDTKFSAEFKAALKEEGIECKRLPVRSPNLNARVERVIQTIKHEVLNHFIVLGRDHLDYLVKTYATHHNTNRPHSHRNHRPPCDQADVPEWTTIKLEDVECREQLGGVIKSMHRKAA